MSREGKADAASAAAASIICPSCSQPIVNSSDACSMDPETSYPERQRRPSPPKKRRLTRSSTSSASVGPKRVWKEELPVYVRTDDGHGEERWEEGIVDKVVDIDPVEGVYEVHVLVPDDAGEMVYPRTIHPHNFDAVRNKDPSIPNYKMGDYIRQRPECLEGLSGTLRQQMRCLLSHKKAGANETMELDVVGESLLGGDAESQTSLRNVVRSMMADDRVKEVVAAATNEDECSPQQALAYLVGQFCGIELSEAVSQDVNHNQLLDQLEGDVHLGIDCPISQVFLMSVMIARTKKQKKFNPCQPLFDSDARDVLSDPVKLKERQSRLDTALAAMHASQTEHPPVTGAAFALLRHGIRMMIDLRGTSDPLLNRLAKEGVCRPAGVLRKWTQLLADAIDPLHTRSPLPSGKSRVLVWTADNADYHLFHRVVSCVPVGSILLGIESERDTTHFNQFYMRGLGRLVDLKAEDLAATDEEDKIAQGVIVRQNIMALLIAAADADWIDGRPAANPSRSTPRPGIGSTVSFTFRSAERTGTVQSYNGSSSAMVEFLDGGASVLKAIPLSDIGKKENANASVQEAPGQGEQQSDPQQREPEMFDGERHRFDPSTTSIASILTGLSSKNNETAREVIQEVIRLHGEDAFRQAVHVIVADQEFMPTIIAQYFSRLTRADELPIIPCLAIGHALKGLSVSMMSFYKCFFDPILALLGVKEGSPEYNRLYKGTVIRDTNSLVMDFTEMLAVAAAHQYLSDVGRDARVMQADESLASPIALINQYVSSPDYPSDRAETVIDSNMRPQSITVTDAMERVANDLQKWAREKWGSSKRPEVGPSGFERDSPDAVAQEIDQEQVELSRSIEEDERYPTYRDKDYRDIGDVPGLLTLCTNAKLLGKSSRKDSDTLAKKLFLHEVRGDSEAALKFGPTRKVPAGTNSTGLALYDLIFGPERLAIVLGHLLTRVRPRDPAGNSRYPREWLVFFKALTVSAFMRYQPNYQRLSLAFLIQLNLILKHKDRRCVDLALKRIRWTFCVNERGDSHKCIPADLLQENSMVAQTKEVGSRDTSAIHNLESRVKLHSYIRLRRSEARAFQFESIIPARASKVQAEQRRSDCTLAFWVDLLIAVAKFDPSASSHEQILGLGDDSKIQVLFADPSRSYWRIIDAIDHVAVSASAFIKGFEIGCEVALPPRPITILRQLHRIRTKKKPSVQSELKAMVEKSKMEGTEQLKDDGYVIVHSSKSLVDGITKAGEGKAKAVPAILSTMSKNEPYSQEGCKFGGRPSKPVVLARSKYEANRVIYEYSERPGGHAPIAVVADFAKDLRAFFPRREGGKGNTVIELARDMICQAIRKYGGVGVELICLTMDVAECMTSLRVIPHAKRGKMDGIKTPHGSLAKVTKGSDDLTPHGARSDLLVCGDAHFTKILFDTMANEMKAIDAGEWSPPPKGRQFVLALIGGSPQACVAVGIGTDRVRLNSKSIAVSCKDFENKMEASQIVRQEEGEIMIFGVLAAICQMGFTHDRSEEGIDITIVLHSDDSDAFAGISMQAMFYLESTCIQRNKAFTGTVFLHGSSKSAAQVSNLGNIFQTNIEIDKELCPTGRGFEFVLNLVAVYNTLEQDDSLPIFPRGHRAMTVASVGYTLTNHDYLKLAPYGLTCSKLIATLKSKDYNAEVSKYSAEEISPVHVPPRAVFHDQKPSVDTGYNLPGILVLFFHAFANRPATNKLLKIRYASQALSSALGYDVLRACAVLAGELHPVPDPVALLAHISCANFHFQRWTCKPCAADRCIDSDLAATCYTESLVKGHPVMSVEYDLRSFAEAHKRGASTEATLLRDLRNSRYGNVLFSDAQLRTNVDLPFDPVAEVKEALKYHGYHPSRKISKELLPPIARLSSDIGTERDGGELADELSNMHEEAHQHLNGDSEEGEGDSDGERSVAGSMSEDESECEEDEIEDGGH